jgi:flavin-dependent dehydrogenase
MTFTDKYNIAILGGGLAGLTLSLQLKQRMPDLDIVVLERRRHPVPEAAHKVGESSVEIGAHYFSNVLGLKEYLQTCQLKKFGFRFFFSDGERDITRVTELGASTFLPTPAYQIDRGLFENALAGFARERGIEFVDGAMVRKFALSGGDSPHTLSYDKGSVTHHIQARWLLDASGRAGMVKRHLDLAELNDHDANAIWFRISERIDINDWSDDRAWLDRCNPPNRWLSTNHLMGEGYWAWLIPLASGSHSVGIVADAQLHPIDTINTFDKAMTWFEKHQPRLFEALDNKRDKLQDFAFFKRFSYGCKQVYSGEQRWALTGEAGVFLDPFYSPGSDFIAIGNTFITELVAQDQAGGPVDMYANIYQQIYFSLYENMLPLYTGQYKLFGDPEVMPVKVIWDYTYYWGVMCQLFFQSRLTDVIAMGRMQKTLANVQQLNIAIQKFLLAWHNVSEQRNPAQMLDQSRLDWFAEMNRGLTDALDDAAFKQRMDDMLMQLDALAIEIVARATATHPSLDGSKVITFVNDNARRGASMLFAQAA